MRFDPHRSRPVGADFFGQPTHLLARALLGRVLVHGTRAGIIVETEAYQGPHDRGAHSFGGRPTGRTAVMFGPPGHAYVYRIYGVHDCLNVVSAPEDYPEAILIRALEPVAGIEAMCSEAGVPMFPASGRAFRKLASGPGRLTRALLISRDLNGHPMWEPPLYIAADASPLPPRLIAEGPRIGIGYAGEATHYPWRYWIRDHPLRSR